MSLHVTMATTLRAGLLCLTVCVCVVNAGFFSYRIPSPYVLSSPVNIVPFFNQGPQQSQQLFLKAIPTISYVLPPPAALNVPLPTAPTLQHEGLHEPVSKYGISSNLEDNLRNGQYGSYQDIPPSSPSNPQYENEVSYNNDQSKYNYQEYTNGLNNIPPRDSYNNDQNKDNYQEYNNGQNDIPPRGSYSNHYNNNYQPSYNFQSPTSSSQLNQNLYQSPADGPQLSVDGHQSPTNSPQFSVNDYQSPTSGPQFSVNDYQSPENRPQFNDFRNSNNNGFNFPSDFSQYKAIDVPAPPSFSSTETYISPTGDFSSFGASQQNEQVVAATEYPQTFSSTTGPFSYSKSDASTKGTNTVFEKIQAIDKTEEYSRNALLALSDFKDLEKYKKTTEASTTTAVPKETSSPYSYNNEDAENFTTTTSPIFGQRLVPKKPRNKSLISTESSSPAKNYLPPKNN